MMSTASSSRRKSFAQKWVSRVDSNRHGAVAALEPDEYDDEDDTYNQPLLNLAEGT